MDEVSGNMILDGISIAIRNRYPDSQIESSDIEQGLTPPAFVLLLVAPSRSPLVKDKWQYRYNFDIAYFPKNGHEECYQVADELFKILEIIALPSGFAARGIDMDYRIVDGVLHFFVTFLKHGYIQPDGESMETIIVT